MLENLWIPTRLQNVDLRFVGSIAKAREMRLELSMITS